MVSRYFTSKEVIAITGVTYRRLDLWVRREIIRPSKRGANGKGSRRLFTFSDVVEVRTLKSLTDNGVRLAALVKCVQRLRADLAGADGSSVSSARLVTDGHTVFRYIAPQDKLESLDEFGQFAFAFGLGDEIASLTRISAKLDRSSRYSPTRRRHSA